MSKKNGMIGAIVGDIAGSRFEWHNRKSKQFTFLKGKEEMARGRRCVIRGAVEDRDREHAGVRPALSACGIRRLVPPLARRG